MIKGKHWQANSFSPFLGYKAAPFNSCSSTFPECVLTKKMISPQEIADLNNAIDQAFDKFINKIKSVQLRCENSERILSKTIHILAEIKDEVSNMPRGDIATIAKQQAFHLLEITKIIKDQGSHAEVAARVNYRKLANC